MTSSSAQYSLAAGANSGSNNNNNNPPRLLSPTAEHRRVVVVTLFTPNGEMCCPSAKIVPTACEVRDGADLCLNQLEGRCQAGTACRMIHVSQRDQMWEKIVIAEPPPDHMTYKPGWKVSCYDTAMTQFLRIASECVYPTRGSEAFISAYNEAGPNFRERFQLCIEFLQQQGRCPNGRNCPQIHAFCADASHVQAHETHVAQDARCLNYMRLPAEKGLVRVYKPNDVDAYDVVPSQYIIYTSGSEVYRSDGTMPRKKMQHCAHFANKRLCNRGVQCSFIHVIPREFWDEQSKAAVGLSSPNPAPQQAPLSPPQQPMQVPPIVVPVRPISLDSSVTSAPGDATHAPPAYQPTNEDDPHVVVRSPRSPRSPSGAPPATYDDTGHTIHSPASSAAKKRVTMSSAAAAFAEELRGREQSQQHHPYANALALEDPAAQQAQAQPPPTYGLNSPNTNSPMNSGPCTPRAYATVGPPVRIASPPNSMVRVGVQPQLVPPEMGLPPSYMSVMPNQQPQP